MNNIKKGKQHPSKKFDHLFEIDWDRFDICPNCGSKRMNDLHTHYKDVHNKTPNTYCIDCGTELQFSRGKIYIVDWAYVN